MYNMTAQEIYDELLDRLLVVKKLAMATIQSSASEFDNGYDCRLANEEQWLERLLTKIEKK